jgi:flagellar secretion chaperone FliS
VEEIRMRAQQAIALYRNVSVETADPMKLVILAYDGAVKAIEEAMAALAQEDYERKGKEIQRAMDLISELMSSLDMDRGGETARTLSGLYSYFLRRLVTAEYKKDARALDEVRAHLVELKAAWEQVTRGGKHPLHVAPRSAAMQAAR